MKPTADPPHKPSTVIGSAKGSSRPTSSSAGIKVYVCLAAAHAMVDCFGSTWSMFKKLAGLDLALSGLIASVALFIAPIMQPVFGAVADHGHRRQLVLAGCALVSLMMLLGPISMSGAFMHSAAGYATMFFVLLLAGLGASMFHPPAVSLAGDTLRHRRSTFVALFIACGMTGMASSHLLFSFVYRGLDRHTEVLLLPAGLIVVWVWRWCRPAESRRHGPLGFRLMMASMAQLPVRLVPLSLVLVLATAHQQGMIFLMPEFAAQRGYDDVFVHGGALGALIAGAAIMMVPMGHLADRFGRRGVMILCLTACIPVHFVLVMTPDMPTALYVVLLFLVGGLAGAAVPVSLAHGQHLLPRQSSLITGLLIGFAWAAASPVLWTVGGLAKQPSLGPSGALTWLGVSLVATAVSVCFVPVSLRQQTLN